MISVAEKEMFVLGITAGVSISTFLYILLSGLAFQNYKSHVLEAAKLASEKIKEDKAKFNLFIQQEKKLISESWEKLKKRKEQLDDNKYFLQFNYEKNNDTEKDYKIIRCNYIDNSSMQAAKNTRTKLINWLSGIEAKNIKKIPQLKKISDMDTLNADEAFNVEYDQTDEEIITIGAEHESRKYAVVG